jgi:tetratricopeptide (TPR) repeat protein
MAQCHSRLHCSKPAAQTQRMKPLAAFALLLLLAGPAYAQSPVALYNSKDFEGLVKLAPKAASLKPEELYMVGFAYFRLENDVKALEFYDKAIAKGLDDGGTHFYKGLSLKYLKQYDAALREVEVAIRKEPANQEYLNEKGVIFYTQARYDEALPVFEQAKKLAGTFPEPYYWTARIYHLKKEFPKALAAYYEAVSYLPKDNSNYANALAYIGQLEYTTTKDYRKSAQAYSKAIALDPSNYELLYKLIKSYNADRAYGRADSVFAMVQTAFDKGRLPKEDQEIKSVAVAQFEWNGQVAVVRKSLVPPKEMLDISYKVFLLNAAGSEVERRFVVEKTIQLEKDGAKHLLCEQQKTGGHITYPYGWSTDNIPLDDLQKSVVMVLNDKMKPSASSNFGKK